jgi:hypothetical protein
VRGDLGQQHVRTRVIVEPFAPTSRQLRS